jgi:hypothetical protein
MWSIIDYFLEKPSIAMKKLEIDGFLQTIENRTSLLGRSTTLLYLLVLLVFKLAVVFVVLNLVASPSMSNGHKTAVVLLTIPALTLMWVLDAFLWENWWKKKRDARAKKI